MCQLIESCLTAHQSKAGPQICLAQQFAVLEIVTKHFNDYEAHNCYMALNRVSDQFKIKVRPFQIGEREYPIAFFTPHKS